MDLQIGRKNNEKLRVSSLQVLNVKLCKSIEIGK